MMRYVPGFTFPLPEFYNSVFPEIPSSQFPVIRLYNYRTLHLLNADQLLNILFLGLFLVSLMLCLYVITLISV